MNANKVAGTLRVPSPNEYANKNSVANKPANLKGVVQQWADRIGVKVREIHLRNMRWKWASISMNGRLTLNTDLLNLPEALTGFVIIHKLVHLLVPNHGKLFKRNYKHTSLTAKPDRRNILL